MAEVADSAAVVLVAAVGRTAAVASGAGAAAAASSVFVHSDSAGEDLDSEAESSAFAKENLDSVVEMEALAVNEVLVEESGFESEDLAVEEEDLDSV